MKQRNNVLSLIVFGLLLSISALAQGTGSISGTVVNRNSQQPVGRITLELQPGGKRAISDTLGNFRLTGLVPGSYALTTSGIGYLSKTINNIVVTSGNENTFTIELDPDVQQLGTVVISGKRNTARVATIESPLSIQRLTTEDIRANPGGNFDISRVIQSLPGVGGGVAGGSYRNDIIIRGGSPAEHVFYLDGIEMPVINHFSTQGSGGGPQGILNVSFIEEVKLSTSAFDAKYDNALSSVFQFRQKNGNTKRLQGNFRLSASEVAATFDGPLSKNTTFLASARRSYLQFLFQALDLPIRPNYWDFQFKTTTRIDNKTTLSFLGIGAIDAFRFAAPKDATLEKLYIINSNPLIQQNTYTVGASLRRLTQNGYINLALSRNTLNNDVDRFQDNDKPLEAERTQKIRSVETENKLRVDVTANIGGWKWSYGGVLQYVHFDNRFFQVFRPALTNASGSVIQQAVTFSSDQNLNFLRYGAFVQAGRRLMQNRLGLSMGVRADANSLGNSSANPLQQLSPRVSLSYALTDKWNVSSSYGLYYRLPSYTQLAYTQVLSGGAVKQNPGDYIRSSHVVAGVEFLPASTTRFTLEGFYKRYSAYPVSISDGISLANKGTETGAIGNEPLQQDGRGRVWGFEFFAQQKLTRKIFGVWSYTYYRSEFSGVTGVFAPANWDNRHLLSMTMGYKMGRNWELGFKFRYQGAAPYTPYNLDQSRLNYLTLGNGVFDFSKVNSLTLPAFHAADVRIDKKWNFRKATFDLFLDIQNLYGAKSAGIPQYTFQRNAANTGFASTDGQPVKLNGANALPVILQNVDGRFLPTVGFIVEF